MVFEFTSQGPKGQIPKLVKYSETIDVNHLMNLNNMIKEFEKTANQKFIAIF